MMIYTAELAKSFNNYKREISVLKSFCELFFMMAVFLLVIVVSLEGHPFSFSYRFVDQLGDLSL